LPDRGPWPAGGMGLEVIVEAPSEKSSLYRRLTGPAGWAGRNGRLFLVLFGVAVAAAAGIRWWAAPLSAGPDVGQFWAFAKVFHAHGLDFYRYADAALDIFPYKGWGYFYPPIWLLILGLALVFVPSSLVAGHTIDTAWRVAEKTPIIAADLAIGILIFWAVPGSRLRKLLFACLWLFHPTAWYESAVFGQFDAIAAALLLASVVLMMKGRDRLAFLLAALAVMTKQHTLIAAALMVVTGARSMGRRRLRTNLLMAGGVGAVLTVPFLMTGNLDSYIRSLAFSGGLPGYQNPLVFASSGTGSLLTYLNNALGWDTRGIFPWLIPAALIAFIVTAIFGYRRQITPLQGALAGFLVFVGLFYRINYQYLIIYIPLAILVAARTPYRSEKIIALLLAVLPAAWLWLGNVPFWFNDHDPHYPWVTPLLARIGLFDRYLPDYAFVALAVAIAGLSLAYVVCVLTRWRGEKQS
jgi:hypothetical protein